jgi:hypothetical protein
MVGILDTLAQVSAMSASSISECLLSIPMGSADITQRLPNGRELRARALGSAYRAASQSMLMSRQSNS